MPHSRWQCSATLSVATVRICEDLRLDKPVVTYFLHTNLLVKIYNHITLYPTLNKECC